MVHNACGFTSQRGEWVIFLDADDDVDDGFIFERWQSAIKTQADVVIFNGWHSGVGQAPIHSKQPYGKSLSGHAWVRHCVTRREWPHYLWLQIIRSDYIRQHNLGSRTGKSHKDILWTVNQAAGNGRFYVSDRKDYVYHYNTESITHRDDYYDIRAISYIEVIADILSLADQPQNKDIRRYFHRHALAESRHFLGLYRKKVAEPSVVKSCFRSSISLTRLAKGISSLRDMFFFIKLLSKLL